MAGKNQGKRSHRDEIFQRKLILILNRNRQLAKLLQTKHIHNIDLEIDSIDKGLSDLAALKSQDSTQIKRYKNIGQGKKVKLEQKKTDLISELKSKIPVTDILNLFESKELKEKIIAEFMKNMRDILLDETQLDLAFKLRGSVTAKGSTGEEEHLALSTLDAIGVFTKLGSKNEEVCSKLGIDIDKRQELKYLDTLALRERLILDAAMWLASDRLQKLYYTSDINVLFLEYVTNSTENLPSLRRTFIDLFAGDLSKPPGVGAKRFLDVIEPNLHGYFFRENGTVIKSSILRALGWNKGKTKKLKLSKSDVKKTEEIAEETKALLARKKAVDAKDERTATLVNISKATDKQTEESLIPVTIEKQTEDVDASDESTKEKLDKLITEIMEETNPESRDIKIAQFQKILTSAVNKDIETEICAMFLDMKKIDVAVKGREGVWETDEEGHKRYLTVSELDEKGVFDTEGNINRDLCKQLNINFDDDRLQMKGYGTIIQKLSERERLIFDSVRMDAFGIYVLQKYTWISVKLSDYDLSKVGTLQNIYRDALGINVCDPIIAKLSQIMNQYGTPRMFTPPNGRELDNFLKFALVNGLDAFKNIDIKRKLIAKQYPNDLLKQQNELNKLKDVLKDINDPQIKELVIYIEMDLKNIPEKQLEAQQFLIYAKKYIELQSWEVGPQWTQKFIVTEDKKIIRLPTHVYHQYQEILAAEKDGNYVAHVNAFLEFGRNKKASSFKLFTSKPSVEYSKLFAGENIIGKLKDLFKVTNQTTDVTSNKTETAEQSKVDEKEAQKYNARLQKRDSTLLALEGERLALEVERFKTAMKMYVDLYTDGDKMIQDLKKLEDDKLEAYQSLVKQQVDDLHALDEAQKGIDHHRKRFEINALSRFIGNKTESVMGILEKIAIKNEKFLQANAAKSTTLRKQKKV